MHPLAALSLFVALSACPRVALASVRGPASPPATADTAASTRSAPSEEAAPASSAPRAKPELPAPRDRLVYSSLLVARLNPLGLEERLNLALEHRLWARRGPLWDQAKLALALTPMLSPGLANVGATATVQPLSVLQLRASYAFVGWFGTFQYLQSYRSPHDEHGPAQLDRGRDLGENYSTTGGQLVLGALAQAKVGPIAVRSDLNAYFVHMRLRDAHDIFYDIRIDALAPGRGWVLTNDSDLLYLHDARITLGVRATTTKAFFPAAAYEPGDARVDPNGPMLRVGPALLYTFFDRPGPRRLNRPTAIVLAQWHVLHRYRVGQQVHPAIPTLVFGVKFDGELWRRRAPAD